MSKLSSLKMVDIPPALADFAHKHNELVSLIESMEGAPGVDIKVIHKPERVLHIGKHNSPVPKKPTGKIKISLNGSAIAGLMPPYVPNIPFTVTMAGTTVSVANGTLNGLIPTNISSTFSAVAGATRYLVLNVTATDGVITGSTLSLDSSAPAAYGTRLGFPPNTFSIPLYVIISLVPYRLIGQGSLNATSVEAFRVQKVMTTPDMLPYDSYYTWQLTNV